MTQEPRYPVQTDVMPADTARAASLMEATWSGRLTAAEFAELFPGANMEDALCHHGTDAEGRPRAYFASDVLQCESAKPLEPSHQAVFIKALLAAEKKPEIPMPEIISRCKGWNEIPLPALALLAELPSGDWEPEEYIAQQYTQCAMDSGISSEDYLRPA